MIDWPLVLQIAEIIILVAIGFFIRSYLPAYFEEKGKNLATKEDIAEITDKIEAVRAQYAVRSHMNTLTFEKEFEILSEVWSTLVDLKSAAQGLRPMLDHVDPNEPADERKRKRLQKFAESYSAFANVVEKNRPFYPTDIYKALFEIMMIAADEADEYRHRDPDRRRLDEKYWRSALDNNRKIVAQVDGVCELIRKRIVA